MVTYETKRVLLTQIIKTREELIRLKNNLINLSNLYKELSIELLTKEERKFYQLVIDGELNSEIFISGPFVDLSGLFPFAKWTRQLYSTDIIEEDKIILRDLNIPMLPEDAEKSYVSRTDFDIAKSYLNDFFYLKYSEPLPLVFDSYRVRCKSLLELKSRASEEQFNRLIESIVEYVDSMNDAAVLLFEMNRFLNRADITLDYLKKNFIELYNIYESSK